MTATCVFCGAEEETAEPVENPVCDRPECMAKAREWGWNRLLGSYIEVERAEDGTIMARLRKKPV